MPEWTSEWPIEPGDYWFIGWVNSASKTKLFSSVLQDPVTLLIHVHRTLNGLVYISGSHVIYQHRGAEGIWQPAIIPKPPNWFRLKYLIEEGK